PYYKRT
ncbi:hypothetical protein D039_3042B, partial [Vibrio parahaemolyticus EKP-028]